MLRRNLRHMLRYPSMTLMLVGMPVVFLLLFVYVFGGTLGAGLGGGSPAAAPSTSTTSRPAILLMTVAAAAQGTAISVAMDMTEGIIARFRTMAIARVSVLTGHVLGSLIQTMVSLALVIGVALLVGFRPTAGPARVARRDRRPRDAHLRAHLALGRPRAWSARASRPRATCRCSLLLLPFLGSGFVPTDSMPAGLRWFAEYQPFTPVIETLRGLLMGTPIGNSGIRSRLVRRYRTRRVSVGQAPVQPRPDALVRRHRLWSRGLIASRRAHCLRLGCVHPHLPPAGRRVALVQKAVGTPAAELGMTQVRDPAEDGRDAAAWPAHRVLDLRERSRPVGCLGQRVEQLSHEVAAAVVEGGDLVRLVHGVLRGVLDEVGQPCGARHSSTLPVGAFPPPTPTLLMSDVLDGFRDGAAIRWTLMPSRW